MDQQKMRIGERVQYYRNLWELSQAELGELLQSSSDYISDIETGRKSISLSFGCRLCTFFGISLSELYWGESGKKPPKNEEAKSLPEVLSENRGNHDRIPIGTVNENSFSYVPSGPLYGDSLLTLLETCTEEECAVCEQVLRQTLHTLRQGKSIETTNKPD